MVSRKQKAPVSQMQATEYGLLYVTMFFENGAILLIDGANKAKFNHSIVMKTF